jgi:hypothetical protein
MSANKRRSPRRAPTSSGSVVTAEFRRRYREHGGSCGDDLATKLTKAVASAGGGIDLEKLKKLAERNAAWKPEYASLNAGLQRMVLSTRLRALVRNGGVVKWGRQ